MLSDAQLLERWNERRDEAAVEVLLCRHGPMVLSVGHRLLRDNQDAEDAFQAAFLTLVRKGQPNNRPQALAAWLYRVAYRIVLRLRRETEEWARREQPGVEAFVSAEADALAQRDLHAVLDEKFDALPERYRQAFVLCYLEGETHEPGIWCSASVSEPTGAEPPVSVMRCINAGRENWRPKSASGTLPPAGC